MQFFRTNISTFDFEPLIVAMAESDSELNLSQNPFLPGLIGKTMNWPVVRLLFLAGDRPVAWFAAINTQKEWFSLPHFNNGAFWFHKTNLNNWILQHHPGYPIDDEIFFRHFINREKWYDKTSGLDQMWVVSLNPDDLDDWSQEYFSIPNLRYRCYLPLLPNTLGHKTDSLLRLKEKDDLQWKSFTRDVRYKIGKAARIGITIRGGGVELLEDFYTVYRRNIHQLGSIGLPFHFFSVLMTNYTGGTATVLVAYFGDKPVGSAILLSWLHYAENPWFATLRKFNRLFVSYSLHWEMIRLAIQDGCKVYSFGHSTKESGVHHYKHQWGALDRTIYLNSNEPLKDELKKIQYLRRIIRLLPLSFAKRMDALVAGKYY